LVKEERDSSALHNRHDAAVPLSATETDAVPPTADLPRSAPPRSKEMRWSVGRLWNLLFAACHCSSEAGVEKENGAAILFVIASPGTGTVQKADVMDGLPVPVLKRRHVVSN